MNLIKPNLLKPKLPFFLLTVENIQHHILYLLEILNFDNIVKFKTAVFTHKILKKKDIPAMFSDFRYTLSQNSICYPRKFV